MATYRTHRGLLQALKTGLQGRCDKLNQSDREVQHRVFYSKDPYGQSGSILQVQRSGHGIPIPVELTLKGTSAEYMRLVVRTTRPRDLDGINLETACNAQYLLRDVWQAVDLALE